MPDEIVEIGNPYEPPRSNPNDRRVATDPKSPRDYERDPRLLTLWLKGLLWAYLGIAVLASLSNIMQLVLLQGPPYTPEMAEANDQRQSAVGLLQTGALVVTSIFFLKWVARSNRNARHFGATDLSFSPNMAAGCYFIPVLNLWRPYQAMKENWQASRRPTSWREQPGTPILAAWWLLWLLNGAINQVALRMSVAAKGIDELINVTYVLLASDACDIGVTLAALALVYGIDGMQRSWVAGLDLAEQPD